jgi:hypothetical protein
VTCAELPDLHPDDRLVIEPLAELGIEVQPVIWDEAGVNWGTFDLTVLRSTWDYARRRDEFVAWARTVPRLANPADVVAWNTDKRYLTELSAAGVPVVPTDWITPGEPWSPPPTGDWVIKPAIGAGSLDSGRYRLADPDQRALAAAHVARLQAAGRIVMVQPYLSAVDTAGETAVLFLGGQFSHAIRKGPLLHGPDELGPAGLYKEEEITTRVANQAELAVAKRALAAIPGGSQRLLYARVDLIPGRHGDPLLVELELTEPSLFLGQSEPAAAGSRKPSPSPPALNPP